MAIETRILPDLLSDIKVIDADTHYTEPHDLWTSRAPAHLKDRVPRIKFVDGKRTWVIDEDKLIGFGACPASTILKDGTKVRGIDFLDFQIEDVHAGSYALKERLEVMDATGVWAQIVYGNVLGFGGQNAASVDHELRVASTKIYNDAMAEMQAESNGRIFPMALLPWWSVAESVAEARRCHAMGMRGININSDPQTHDMPDLGETHWDPLWEVCVELGLSVNFHIGASDVTMDWIGDASWPSHGDEAKMALGSASLFFGNARVMANIIYSGLLDRWPELKFVSVESGIGWIPFLLEALDYQLIENGPKLANRLKLKPSEYFLRNFYGCFWFEQRNLQASVAALGADNLMFETDFPHPTCLYPYSANFAAQAMAGFDMATRRKLLSGNAAKLYNIPLG